MTLKEARAVWSPHIVATGALSADDYVHYVRTACSHAAADLAAAGATHDEVMAHTREIHKAVNETFMDRALYGEVGHA